MMSKAAEKKMPTEELSMQPVSHLDVETVVLDQKIKETFCQRNLGLIKQVCLDVLSDRRLLLSGAMRKRKQE